MDKISEIFNSIKDRLSNPLIFSFLVSWLVYNWKIPVALIWFDEKQISANGCKSIFEFIENELSKGYFWIPCLFAFGYTFLFPIVKNLISATQTWMKKWGENLNLQISKGGKVGIEKYLKLRNEYVEKIDELDKIISKESETREYNKLLFAEKADLDAKNFQLQQQVELLNNEIESISDLKFLQGQWKFTITDNMSRSTSQDIKILGNKLFRIISNNIESSPTFLIDNFFYDKKYKKIIFIKKGGEEKKLVNIITYSNEAILEGRENNYFVKYERLPSIHSISAS